MKEYNNRLAQRNRKIVGISIMTIIAFLHLFRVENNLSHSLYQLYMSYAFDVMLPFGVYFLLCMSDHELRLFRKWHRKVLAVLGLAILIEILQFFGVHALGATFDLLDIPMYGLGVGIAVVFDRILLKRTLQYWDSEENVPQQIHK